MPSRSHETRSEDMNPDELGRRSMNYITITAAAYEALVAWKPEAIQFVEPAPGGGFNLSLLRPQLQMLNAFQVGRELQRTHHPSRPRE
jgi:hypothetical protein